MKGVVCHARDGLCTGETEPVTLCKQTCDTFILGSSQVTVLKQSCDTAIFLAFWRVYIGCKWENGIIKMLEFYTRNEIKYLFSILLEQQ